LKTIIALLDKEYPPSESFIDAMLAIDLPNQSDIKVQLLVSGAEDVSVIRYKKAACLPKLYSRRGAYRFLNFFKAVYLLWILIKRNKTDEIVLFVRNDPIYLIACSLLKQKNMKLIFQSTFPHEEVSGSFIKRAIAKWLYKLGGVKVDSLLTVSPKGLERIQKILPHVRKGVAIPMLSEVSVDINDFTIKGKDGKVKFIYIGDHSQSRKLEVVLQAIVKANEKGLNAEFRFIGGKKNEIEKLRCVNGVESLENTGVLEFVKKIPRRDIWDELINSDVGLSLIPPDKHFLEASPTKLTESMGMGLAVVASYGIDLQEEFVEKSNGGLLCQWNKDAIAECLISICYDRHALIKMKKNAYEYATKKLNYKEYIEVLRELM